jgi:formate dehydrogenase subunit gamma
MSPHTVTETGAIQRYTMAERVVHWIAAITYTYVLATGLAFYSPHLFWIATLLGGAPTSRFWHPIVALFFLATLLRMLVEWIGDMRITAVDRAWGRAMKSYIENEDENLPPADRFNLGQKYFFWAMIWGGLGLLLSGLILWFPERIPWSLRDLRYAAVLVHVACALITIGAFIIHVYMGTAMVRGGFTSIIRGEVSPAWARMHHRLWYHRVTGK